MSNCSFKEHFSILTVVVYLHLHYSTIWLLHAGLVPCKTAATSVNVLCMPYNHAPIYTINSIIALFTVSLYLKLHNTYIIIIRLHYLCVWLLPVLCAFGRITSLLYRVTSWNGYWNESQQRQLTLEKKILPPHPSGNQTHDRLIIMTYVQHSTSTTELSLYKWYY